MLDVDVADGCDPIPELGGGGEKQVLPGLRDLHVGSRIGEPGSLQLGVLRIDEQAAKERNGAAEEQLVIVADGQIGNLRISDRLAITGGASNPGRMANVKEGVVEAHGLRAFAGTGA